MLTKDKQTGFSKRTIIRWAKDIETKDMVSFLTHGNKGRQPSTLPMILKYNLSVILRNHTPASL